MLYAWKKVSLARHSCNTTGLLLGIFEPELRLAAKRLQIPARDVLVAAAVSALFHDAGKIARPFQERIEKGLEPRFTCHELVSGGIALDAAISILRDLGSNYYRILGPLAGLAALRHHHAMRSLKYCEKKARTIPGVRGNQVEVLAREIARECPWLRDLLGNAAKNITRKYYDPLQSMRRTIEAVRKTLGRSGIQKELVAMTASTLTGTLGLADYLAAAILDERREDQQNPPGYAHHVLRELEWRISLKPGEPHTREKLSEISRKGLNQLVKNLTESH